MKFCLPIVLLLLAATVNCIPTYGQGYNAGKDVHKVAGTATTLTLPSVEETQNFLEELYQEILSFFYGGKC